MASRGAFGGDGDRHRAARRRIAGLRPDALLLHGESMARLRRSTRTRGRGAARRSGSWIACASSSTVFVRLVLGVRDEQRARAAVAALRRALRTPATHRSRCPATGTDWPASPATRCSGAVPGRSSRSCGRRSTPAGAQATSATTFGAGRRAARLRRRDRGELLVLLMAAQEPPSIALTRLVARLNRAPAEPDADAIRETLRLWPPAFAILRRLTAAREVAGHPLRPARRSSCRFRSCSATHAPPPIPTCSGPGAGGTASRRRSRRSGAAPGGASGSRWRTSTSRRSCRHCCGASGWLPSRPTRSRWCCAARCWCRGTDCWSRRIS